MKVLAIMVDVTNMKPDEIDDLQFAMEVQCEEAVVHLGEDARILSSKVKDLGDVEEEEQPNTH